MAGLNTIVYDVPVLQIRHRSVVMYYEPLYWQCRRNNKKVWQWKSKQLHKTAYQGKVTAGVRKRLTKAVNLFMQTIKPQFIFNPVSKQYQYHKLSFVTLKIPNNEGKVTGRIAYDECLSKFLDWMAKTKKVKLYIWKLEPEKRDQVHYHLTIPDWIHYQEIRDSWNGILRKAGFLDEYATEHLNFDANSTDIHEVRDVQDLASYMVKAFADSLAAAEAKRQGKKAEHIGAELGKDLEPERETEGKVWGCSEILSASHYVKFLMGDHHIDLVNKMKQAKQIRELTDESGRWCVWYFNDSSPPDILTKAENNFVNAYVKWQMERPSKSAAAEDLVAWTTKKPFLN